jgi:hypothetical protein
LYQFGDPLAKALGLDATTTVLARADKRRLPVCPLSGQSGHARSYGTDYPGRE